MYLFGGTLTKLLAAVMAVTTAVSGLPRVQCVCPNGQVKLFCPGPSAPGCCCPATAAVPGDNPSQKHACCVHSTRSQSPGSDHAKADRPCGCERSVVAAAPQAVPEDDGGATCAQFAMALAWGLSPFVPDRPVRRAAVRSGVHRHPPDIVVMFCHFTC